MKHLSTPHILLFIKGCFINFYSTLVRKLIKGGGSRAGFFLFFSFAFSAFPVSAASPFSVVINEIAWMGTTASYNDEWIEFYNNNADSKINLSDWKLVAKDGSPEINLAGEISANSFYLLERTDDNAVPNILADQIYSGALGNNGEILELYDGSGNLIDSLNFSSGWPAGDNSTKQTMERKNSQSAGTDSTNWATSQSVGGTPKNKNSIILTVQQTEPLSQPKIETQEEPAQKEEQESEPLKTPEVEKNYPSGIVLNEILPSPIGPDEEEEWIEIFNQNAFEIDLSGWQLTDSLGKITTFTFPNGTKINPQGFLLFTRPNTKITFNNDGDGISLIQPDGKIVETINYPKSPQNQSYNRIGSEWLWSTTLTPGKVNILTAAETKGGKKGEDNELSSETKKELASIGEQIPELSQHSNLLIFLIAFFLSIFCATIILLIKKKLK